MKLSFNNLFSQIIDFDLKTLDGWDLFEPPFNGLSQSFDVAINTRHLWTTHRQSFSSHHYIPNKKDILVLCDHNQEDINKHKFQIATTLKINLTLAPQKLITQKLCLDLPSTRYLVPYCFRKTPLLTHWTMLVTNKKTNSWSPRACIVM
jgi:hypothetical protein